MLYKLAKTCYSVHILFVFFSELIEDSAWSPWIGLRDVSGKGDWTWIDESPEGFYNWFDGEPSNYNGNDFCVHVRFFIFFIFVINLHSKN